MPITAAWSDSAQSREVSVATVDEIRKLIQSIVQQGTPVLLQLYDKGVGAELGVGLGREVAVITYQRSLEPPYFISLGDPTGQGTTWFHHGGEPTEYLARNLVRADLVWPTVEAFIATLARPETIRWESL